MDKVKRYKTYLAESPPHYESIMKKYGMPDYAKPPRQKELLPINTDRQYREALARTLYMKKGKSFNVNQPT